jgi:SRSO17 transposase
MLGLLSNLDRKNCWSIAEHRGARSPDALQHLLSRTVWDADLVRDDLRGYVIDHLGDPAVLVVDETGHLRKGSPSVGVQRQYTGNCGPHRELPGRGLPRIRCTHWARVDRPRALPAAVLAERPDRCADAGIPPGTEFATKPALATAMITAALDAGTPASWVAGDEVYGADPTLRATLEGRDLGYVLAVASNRRVPTANGPLQVDFLAATLPARSWRRLSAGAGSHGHRMYSWAWISINPGADGHHWVLLRRNDNTGEIAHYRGFSPRPVPLSELVKVAGQRWRVEERSRPAKGSPAWTSIRSGSGNPGIGGSPWRCSRTRS